jgi:DnaJ-class molecular chaperone
MFLNAYQKCQACNGTGKRKGEKCLACDGSGKIEAFVIDATELVNAIKGKKEKA